ncbi:MAG: DNA-binding MarR family transcriptional regulator [Patiriisocius sp.]|jgi:DNA-binding MarR family transcriptional regulator
MVIVMDLLRQLGPLALGSRLKRLSDRLMQDGIKVYRQCELDFEPKWFPVFYYLSDRGPSSVTDIARGIGITHPSVNQIAKEMIIRGYVAAYKDPKDKRRRVLALSASAKANRESLSQTWQVINDALSELIDETGVDFLTHIETLERALANQSFLERFNKRYNANPLDYKIVPYTPELAQYFSDINQRWINEYFEMEAADKRALDDPEGYIIQPGGKILFVRNSDGVIVGTCALIRHSESIAELAKMGVDKRQRSGGAGKLLGLAIIEQAREMGFTKLFLETNSVLAPAIGLYKRLGFAQKPFPHASDYSRADVYMELDLGSE